MSSISIVVPFDDRWYFAEIVSGASEAIATAGHAAVVRVVPPTATSTVRAVEIVEADFRLADCVGAIAAGFRYRPDQRERTQAWNRPLVMIGGSVTGFPTVMIDDIAGARVATKHLLSLGHTRITHIAGPLHDQMDFSVHGRRARGYRLAMEQAGLTPDTIEIEFDEEAVHQGALDRLSRPDRPSAIFVHADEMAFPVLQAASELDLAVGRDLSVVGFDDHPDAEIVGLTTIRQRPADLGRAAAGLILQGGLAPLDQSRSRLEPTTLVTRSTSGRLR